MKVRRATSEDIPFMMALDRACPTSAHWDEQRYRELFHDAETGLPRLVLVAEHPEPGDHSPQALTAADGFLVARHTASEWELENIVVSPAWRRTGLGKRLLAALLSAARETDSEAVFLEVRESNTAARGLYEDAGFQPQGRRKSYYGNPLEDAIVYRRRLR